MHPGPEQPIIKAGSVAMSVDGHPRIDADEHELARLGTLLALGKLAPSVIHEINNPLFAILGLLEFLLAEAEPGSKAEQRLLLMQQSGLEIKSIVRTILDFSRERTRSGWRSTSASSRRRPSQLFCRTSVARDVESRCRGRARAVDGRRQQAGPEGRAPVLLVERGAGPVGRRQRSSSRSPATTETVSSLASTDTGEGVARADRDAALRPFFTTRAQHGAAGLGLAIAARDGAGPRRRPILERATPGATFPLAVSPAA